MKGEFSRSSVERQVQHRARAAAAASATGPMRVDAGGAAHERQRRVHILEHHQRRERGDDRRSRRPRLRAPRRRPARTSPSIATTAKRAGARIAWKPKTMIGEPRVERPDAVGAERQHDARDHQRGRRDDQRPRVAAPCRATARQRQRRAARSPETSGARRAARSRVARRTARAARSKPGAPVQQVVGRHLRVALDRRGVRGGFEQIAAEPFALLRPPVRPGDRARRAPRRRRARQRSRDQQRAAAPLPASATPARRRRRPSAIAVITP